MSVSSLWVRRACLGLLNVTILVLLEVFSACNKQDTSRRFQHVTLSPDVVKRMPSGPWPPPSPEPPTVLQSFSHARPEGAILSETARQLAVQNTTHLTLDDPSAGLLTSTAACLMIRRLDEEAHRLLHSLALFEVNTILFVSCTKALAHLLPKLFQNLRFVLYPELEDVGSGEHQASPALNALKPELLRRALDAGVQGAWYLDSGMVLLAELPDVSPGIQVAFSQVDSSSGYEKPGAVFFRSQRAIQQWATSGTEAPLQSIAWEEEATAIETFGCGVAAEVKMGRHGGGHVASSIEVRGNSVVIDGCPASSMRALDQGPKTVELFAGLLTSFGRHPASELFEKGLPSQFSLNAGARRLSSSSTVWAGGQPVPWWYNAEVLPLEERVLVHQRRLVSLQDPEANMVGKVVLCACFNKIDDEVKRYFEQHRIFHASMPIVVSTTQECVNQLLDFWPDIRFVFLARLDRYRDPTTSKWLGRNEMAKKKLWIPFNSERPNMMKFAMMSGASAVWYMDTDIVLLAPLPTLDSSVEVGLSHQKIQQSWQDYTGRYNSGLAYFASVKQIDKWLNGRKEETTSNIAQTILNQFRDQPGVLELSCSLDEGWYEMDPGFSMDKKPYWDAIKCNDGHTITFKGCPSQSLHFHVSELGWRILPGLTTAMEKCMNPALPVWHPVTYDMPEFKTPLMYWNRALDTFDVASNVVGKTVYCLIADGVGPELRRFLAALKKFQGDSAVFISGTEDVAKITKLYPSMRLRVFPHFNRTQAQPQARLPNPLMMRLSFKRVRVVAEDGYGIFLKEKAFLLRAALSAGAREARFLAADQVGLAESGSLFSTHPRESSFTSLTDVYRWNRTQHEQRDRVPWVYQEVSNISAICHRH